MVALRPEDAPGCPSGLEPDAGTGPRADPAAFVRRTEDGANRLELAVSGARCGACIAKIEKGLIALPGIEAARLNLSTGRLAVVWRGRQTEPAAIVATLSRLGYGAAPYDPQAVRAEDDAEGRLLIRSLAVAGFAAANVMLLSVSIWGGAGEMGDATRTLFHWISGLIAIPAALYAGRPFFRSAIASLSRGRANMDVPISLAVLLALGLSVFETARSGTHAYFDAAVMLLFFLLIGRYLDHLLRWKARAAARELIALQAVSASRIAPDGTLKSVSARDLDPGDRILLAAGDRLAVDGVIEEGISDLDVSLVTGESAPVTGRSGTPVHAGTVNRTAPLTVRVSARVEDSLVAELARLIEAGEQAKTRYVRLADRAATLYVPLVHSAALAVFIGWMAAGAGVADSLHHAIALLIITCPCALGLAVPVVQVVATGRLFKAGVLVKSGDALERLAEADMAVFDKTGTLTQGRATLVERPDDPEALATAAKLARASRHPLARALAAEAGPGLVAREAVETAGEGIAATIDGVAVRLGRKSFVLGLPSCCAEDADGAGAGSEIWLRRGDGAPLRFGFEDGLKADAAETLRALEARGLPVELLSGDREAAVARSASDAGLERWRAEIRPEDKAAYLTGLKADGRRALMAGDGLNDAAALALAHVSVSPGSAAGVAQAAADFVVQGERLAPIVLAVDVARAARRRVLENFAFAALYNVCAVPLAAMGFVTPLIAALAMSGSSIVVMLNALRLSRMGGRSWTPS